MAVPISNTDPIPIRQRPSRDEVLMRQAQIVAERSTCTRAHVGVVIAHESRVVSQGYNGAPSGMSHCDHTCNCIGRFPERLGNTTLAGHVFHEKTCPKTAPCSIAVHAEANAIAFAAKHGVATMGAELFTTMAPCLACSQLIVNAGIVRVVFAKQYRYDEGITLLMEAGISVVFGG